MAKSEQAEVNTSIPENVPHENLLRLFHERIVHRDEAHVKKLVADCFHTKVKDKNSVCEPCALGKAHRLLFGEWRKATRPGKLLSADICRPFDQSYSDLFIYKN